MNVHSKSIPLDLLSTLTDLHLLIILHVIEVVSQHHFYQLHASSSHLLQHLPFPPESFSLLAFYCQMFATSETQQQPADKDVDAMSRDTH